MGNIQNPQLSHEWWRGSVIYQVYPRSLKDSNGDGIGDIPGITEKLEYIANLGVEAIWISPFFESPMKDFGYDVSDYRNVDPIFGCNQDFEALIRRAHELNLKVIIDQVLSHTSDQHQWFKESRLNKTNSKADWYVWADATEDGQPPNNWLSIFGGSAWQWDEVRGQYYLHNFLVSQPDLNYHCSEVRKQMLAEVEYWLQRNVDGVRLDAINFCFHDSQLRSNPPKPVAERTGRGFSANNPYAAQYHYFDNTRPENIAFIESLRCLLDRYPGTMSLGEINSEDSLKTMAEYTDGSRRLHMGYNFELLADDFSAEYIRSTVASVEQQCSNSWPCWAVSNHDVARVVSRWGNTFNPPQNQEKVAKLLIALLGCLRGTICTYQGEELGLTEASIEFEQLQDPFGLEFWPDFKGRDGCRTPIPWNPTMPNMGFSNASPWLPIPSEHKTRSVFDQENDPHSVLNFYRNFLHWRGTHDCMKWGTIKFLDHGHNILAFEREYKEAQMQMYFNLGSSTETVSPVGTTVSLCSEAVHIENFSASSTTEVTLEPCSFICTR